MKNSNRTWFSLMLGLLTFFVTACGDSNSSINEVSGQPAQQQAPLFTGNFLGAANLGAGQTSVLNLNVAANGTATGTVTVSAARAQSDSFLGTYDVNGSVDTSTGAFTATGTIPGVGPFTISGTLPMVANGQGAYSLTVANQTFNGLIQNASQGVPTPPPTGGGAGGGGDIGQRIINGGQATLNFQPGNGYNGFTPSATGAQLAGAVVTNSTTSNLALVVLLNPTAEGTTPVINGTVFGIVTRNGEPLEIGKAYPLTTLVDTTSLLSLGRLSGTSLPDFTNLDAITNLQSNPNWVVVPGQSQGTATLTELTSTGMSMTFNFSNVVPNPEVPGNTAAGSFSASGSVTATFAPPAP